KPLARGYDLHETLHGAIAWSWRLLDASERRALSACSIFPGSFTADAAARIIEPSAGRAVLDILTSLVGKPMIRGESGLLRLYDGGRDFALDELRERGRYERAALAFATRTLERAHETAGAAYVGDLTGLGELEVDHGAVAASVDHLIALAPKCGG